MALYTAPQRRITQPSHLAAFKASPAYRALNAFILGVNAAIKGKATTDPFPTNDVCEYLCRTRLSVILLHADDCTRG